MKRVVGGLIMAVVLSVCFSVPSAFAQVNDPASQDINNRLLERTTRNNTVLTNLEKARVSGLCIAAQGKAKAVLQKIQENHQPYEVKLASYTQNLTGVEQKLQTAGKDTSALKTNISELNDKQVAYKASLEALRLSMNDLTTMDCKAQPSGFQATLVDARNQLRAVQDVRKDIRDYSAASLTTTLKSLKDAH